MEFAACLQHFMRCDIWAWSPVHNLKASLATRSPHYISTIGRITHNQTNSELISRTVVLGHNLETTSRISVSSLSPLGLPRIKPLWRLTPRKWLGKALTCPRLRRHEKVKRHPLAGFPGWTDGSSCGVLVDCNLYQWWFMIQRWRLTSVPSS